MKVKWRASVFPELLQDVAKTMVINSNIKRTQAREKVMSTKPEVARRLSDAEWEFIKSGWSMVDPINNNCKYPIATEDQLSLVEQFLDTELSLPNCIVTTIRGIEGIHSCGYHTDKIQSGISIVIINASKAQYTISFKGEDGDIQSTIGPWEFYMMAGKYRMIYKHAVLDNVEHNIISIGFINMDVNNDPDIDLFK